MALNLPDWATDWKTAILTAERRLSPCLEQAVRTDVFLDAMTVANSLNRLAHRSADAARFSIANALEVSSVDLLSGFEEGKVSEVEAAVAVTPLAEGLLKAFAGISSPAVRAALVNLTAVLAQESAANARD